MAQIDLRNPPNEFPDIVGYKPENPLAANFKPYISARTRMRELTPLPLIVGTLLGIIFGASSLYLVLKVGLTVSASIPVAVISITLFRLLSKVGLRDATILENNIVQTAGSAGESIAFGLGVTMPAIMILGFDLEITRVMLVATLGGLLGILMMIPLRRALIVDQHGLLEVPGRNRLRRSAQGGGNPAKRLENKSVTKSATRRKDNFHRLRNRLHLSVGDECFQCLEEHAGENLRRAIQGRIDLDDDRAGIVRRGLHHRAADRFHHVRRRRARLSRAHPGDQIFRRKLIDHSRAGHDADQSNDTG